MTTPTTTAPVVLPDPVPVAHYLTPDEARALAGYLMSAAQTADGRSAAEPDGTSASILLDMHPDTVPATDDGGDDFPVRDLFVSVEHPSGSLDVGSLMEILDVARSIAEEDAATSCDLPGVPVGLGLLGVDSGHVLLVDPSELPLDVLREITTPNANAYTPAVVVGTLGGDGLFPVASLGGGLALLDGHGAEWRSADVAAFVTAFTS